MKIKASRVNNLTDARYFAAWGVEWMGFCLEIGSPDYVAPQDIKEIKDWLVGPQIVGEFGIGQSAQEINAAVELLHLDMVQLSTFVEKEVLEAIEAPVIKELKIVEAEQFTTVAEVLPLLKDKVQVFLLDMTGGNVDWTTVQLILQQLCLNYPIVLKLDCQPADLSTIKTTINPLGIAVEGGEEEAVGVKAFDDLDEWFERLEDMAYKD